MFVFCCYFMLCGLCLFFILLFYLILFFLHCFYLFLFVFICLFVSNPNSSLLDSALILTEESGGFVTSLRQPKPHLFSNILISTPMWSRLRSWCKPSYANREVKDNTQRLVEKFKEAGAFN